MSQNRSISPAVPSHPILRYQASIFSEKWSLYASSQQSNVLQQGGSKSWANTVLLFMVLVCSIPFPDTFAIYLDRQSMYLNPTWIIITISARRTPRPRIHSNATRKIEQFIGPTRHSRQHSIWNHNPNYNRWRQSRCDVYNIWLMGRLYHQTLLDDWTISFK